MAQSTEVDSITKRDEIVEVMAPLDVEANRRIQKALRRANRFGRCSTKRLYKALGKTLRAGPEGLYMVAPMEMYSNWGGDIPNDGASKSDSIYERVRVYESPPIALYPLGNVIRVNTHIIAGDKFSHFFNVGWTYYTIHYQDNEPVEAAIDYGETTERTIWGLMTTGVFSWADLSANFAGMRFWASVLGESDVLGRELHPLVTCEHGDWVQSREFSWAHWIDASWDEGINCNDYAPRFADKIQEVNEQRLNSGLPICPIQPAECVLIRKNLGTFADSLVNPLCTD